VFPVRYAQNYRVELSFKRWIRGSNLAAVMCTTVQVSKNAVIPNK
jgi:hypothetical protein